MVKDMYLEDNEEDKTEEMGENETFVEKAKKKVIIIVLLSIEHCNID
jgi:hypothetical protein